MAKNDSAGGGLGMAIRITILGAISSFVFTAVRQFAQNLTLIQTGIPIVDSIVSGAIALVVTLLLVLAFLEKAVPGLKKKLGIDF
jgi:hypothetical protein